MQWLPLYLPPRSAKGSLRAPIQARGRTEGQLPQTTEQLQVWLAKPLRLSVLDRLVSPFEVWTTRLSKGNQCGVRYGSFVEVVGSVSLILLGYVDGRFTSLRTIWELIVSDFTQDSLCPSLPPFILGTRLFLRTIPVSPLSSGPVRLGQRKDVRKSPESQDTEQLERCPIWMSQRVCGDWQAEGISPWG